MKGLEHPSPNEFNDWDVERVYLVLEILGVILDARQKDSFLWMVKDRKFLVKSYLLRAETRGTTDNHGI